MPASDRAVSLDRADRDPVDGVLVIDKPEGMTSHDVVALARRHLRERRIGHTGTLDPLATGVLPLACGRATRLVRFLSASTKEYEAVVRFGLTTDSCDVTGAETSRTGRSPSASQVEEALRSLRGEYLQVPPAFSAKKVGGVRAYALARDRQPVALRPCRVRVSRAALLDLRDGAGTFAISCSAGFYVRSFAQTLGQIVGTGACLQALRRTRSGEFGLDRAVTVAELLQAGPGQARGLVGMDDLLADLPGVRLTEEGERRVAHGREVGREHQWRAPAHTPEAPAGWTGERADGAAEHWVRILDRAGRLIALGTPLEADEALHPSIVLI
jgi:tRNA pseudouridine55 synthase